MLTQALTSQGQPGRRCEDVGELAGLGREASWEGEPRERIRDLGVCIRAGPKNRVEQAAWIKCGGGERELSGGSGLWLGGWWCQAGTEVVLPASAPPPGSESPWTLPSRLSLGPRHPCLPECLRLGCMDRGRLHRANNGLQTSRPGTKGCLSSRQGLVALGGDGSSLRGTRRGQWV